MYLFIVSVCPASKKQSKLLETKRSPIVFWESLIKFSLFIFKVVNCERATQKLVFFVAAMIRSHSSLF